MLIDYNTLKDKQKGSGYILGLYDKSRSQSKLNYLGGQGDELVGRFEGVNTFIDFVKENYPKGKYSSDSTKNGGDGDFHRFKSYDEALDTFRNHPEKIAEFVENDDKILGGDSAGNSIDYDITGDYIDMGRFIEGIPESFGLLFDGNPRSKRIDILVTGMFSWRVSHDSINYRAERIKRLVDWLEANHIRCRITYLFTNDNWHCEIGVKQFDEIFDINDLAIVSHPEFFRRLQFRFAEWSPSLNTWNYGSSADFWRAYNDTMIETDYNNEYGMLIGSDIPRRLDKAHIDSEFDKLEKQIQENIIDETGGKRTFKIFQRWA